MLFRRRSGDLVQGTLSVNAASPGRTPSGSKAGRRARCLGSPLIATSRAHRLRQTRSCAPRGDTPPHGRAERRHSSRELRGFADCESRRQRDAICTWKTSGRRFSGFLHEAARSQGRLGGAAGLLLAEKARHEDCRSSCRASTSSRCERAPSRAEQHCRSRRRASASIA
jgi:hypothetical protein